MIWIHPTYCLFYFLQPDVSSEKHGSYSLCNNSDFHLLFDLLGMPSIPESQLLFNSFNCGEDFLFIH